MGKVPEWYSVLFGCFKLGIVAMPGTSLLTAKDIASRIKASGAKIVVVSAEHVHKVEEIRAECDTLQHMVVVRDGASVGEAAPAGWSEFAAICEPEPAHFARSDAEPMLATDTMMTYFTSGTTGPPKMVPRDFAYSLAHAATAAFWMDLKQGEVHWSITDTGWAKAAWGILFPQMLAGATIVLYDAPVFDAEKVLSVIGQAKVSTFCAPPTVYRVFAQQELGKYDLSSLRRCLGAGEPLNPEVIRHWQKHTGCVIADGYGQTETINIVANFPGLTPRIGSMGQPVPGYDIEIIDDAGVVQAVGEVGHIAVRADEDKPWPPGLFRGYEKQGGGGVLDKSSFKHGWYYTGDLASRDKDGYLWFVGRADDLISSAGYRISPFEVESALIEHPAVQESAVIGVPDAERGELVKAYIILAKGFTASDELAKEIQVFCKQQTAPYKYPRRVEFCTELPKTVSGKIRRVELRQNSKD
jgi:acetyl-CoA synthetase